MVISNDCRPQWDQNFTNGEVPKEVKWKVADDKDEQDDQNWHTVNW